MRFPSLRCRAAFQHVTRAAPPRLVRKRPRTQRPSLERLEDRTLLNAGWLFGLGGAGTDSGQRSVVDAAGNIYVAGGFSSTLDFDPGNGTFDLVNTTGTRNGFLAKYDSQGALQWARSVNGPNDDNAWQAVLDGAGHLYAVGWGGPADFGDGVTVSTTGSWVAKFVADTGTPLWARGFATNSTQLAVDGTGYVYATGSFGGTVDFDPGTGTANLSSVGGNNDAFVVKLDPWGNYVTAWQMGGAASSSGNALLVDGGTVYVAGNFSGTVDFDPGLGTQTRTSAGGTDLFFASYTSAGTLNWAQSVGGASEESWSWHRGTLSVDANHLTYAEEFQGTADLDPGSGVFNLTSAGGMDIFIARYARADGALAWAKRIGGSGDDHIQMIARDAAGTLYVTGQFAGTVDFDPGPGAAPLMATGSSQDGFLLQLDAAGNYASVRQFAGPGGEFPRFAGVYGGLAYVTGYFTSTASFPNGQSLTSAGHWDAFVLAFDPQIAVPTPRTYSTNVSLPIPSRGTVLSTLTITDTYTISDVNVTLSINHRNVDHLDVYLIAPDGTTRIELFTDVGGSGDNFTGTTLDDESAVAITSGSAPFSLSYRPEGFLGVLDNKPVSGTWRLEITDDTQGTGGTLLSWSLIVTGPASGGSPLSAGGPGPGAGAGGLTPERIAPLLREAAARWKAAGADTSELGGLEVHIADLGGSTLGLASHGTVWLDDDAAGWGWFVDPTPWADEEFPTGPGSPAWSRIDLLSVLAHELGHLLGHEHEEGGVMAEALMPGVRLVPRLHDDHDKEALDNRPAGRKPAWTPAGDLARLLSTTPPAALLSALTAGVGRQVDVILEPLVVPTGAVVTDAGPPARKLAARTEAADWLFTHEGCPFTQLWEDALPRDQ